MKFFFAKKNELDNKSKSIAIMHLHKAKSLLEEELASKERVGENEIFTANHDIKCLENTIAFLSSDF